MDFTAIYSSMTIRNNEFYKVLIIDILDKISIFNKCRKDFLCEVLILFLCIKGRINFLQFARFGKFKEQRYRQQSEKPFAFLEFNKELALSYGGKRFVIAFDPSYINKSGKKTPRLGWYWSGCAGKSKWGIEIGGLAAIDIENHTAFHLEAVQTIIQNKGPTTLIDWYTSVVKQQKETLVNIFRYLAAAAHFAKRTFDD